MGTAARAVPLFESRDEQVKLGSKNFRVTPDHRADINHARAIMPNVSTEQIVLLTSAIGLKIFLSMGNVTGLFGTGRDKRGGR